jgi:hypothetical protein
MQPAYVFCYALKENDQYKMDTEAERFHAWYEKCLIYTYQT